MHIFFGDERFVPPDHPDSNYRMAREAMLAQVPIPEGNVHPVPTTPYNARRSRRRLRDDAEELLRRRHAGPCASRSSPSRCSAWARTGIPPRCFPGTAALTERTAWVTSVIGAKPEPRISLTYPVLDSSAALIFLIAGAGKDEMLERLRAGDQALPAAHVQPVGEFYIFCDEAAVGRA